jgi:hypothetical protein
MPEKQFKTIAEIDAELDKILEEAKTKPETESEETDETVEAEPESKEATEDSQTEEDEVSPDKKDTPIELEPVKEQPAKDKANKDDKRDYAFKQLREEADNAKKELNNKTQVVSEFELIAKSQGFDNVDSFLSAWKEKQLEEQAKKQNLDPRVLKELQETKERLSKIEKEKEEVVKSSQISRVNNTISKFATKHKLSEDDMSKIIQTMGGDSVTVDILVATPNETLEKMLTGYAQEILIEKKVQERLAKMETEDTPKSEKHKNTVTSKKPDPFSKEALDDEMEAFRKQNYPWLK